MIKLTVLYGHPTDTASSPEGQATAADLPNFATGSVIFFNG